MLTLSLLSSDLKSCSYVCVFGGGALSGWGGVSPLDKLGKDDHLTVLHATKSLTDEVKVESACVTLLLQDFRMLSVLVQPDWAASTAHTSIEGR